MSNILDILPYYIGQIGAQILLFNLILGIFVIFFQRKEPRSTWAWLLVLYFIPYVGFIIYLLAGTDMHKRKMFRVKEIEDRLHEALRNQEYAIKRNGLVQIEPKVEKFSDLIYYNINSSQSVLSNDNAIDIYTVGNDKFRKLKSDMEAAKHFIHIQYYIIKKDKVFNEIVEILLKKAKEGVEVRILYDSMGCRTYKKSDWKLLEKQGILIAEFFPAWLRRFQLRINYRNHRKIVVIDNQIGYVGGFNIGKEYIGLDKRFGAWRDTHLRISGTSVVSLQIRFMLDWNYASKNKIPTNDFYCLGEAKGIGKSFVQIVTSGPDSSVQNIRNNYLRLIAKAEKYIYIQTPYFIPDESILNSLIIALGSGIDVSIMIPNKPDHPFVYWATYSYIGELVRAGARCYIYEDGFLHAKGMIMDGKAYCYGTANMDIRSFALNFEVNAIVYGEEEAKEMEEIYHADIKKCRRITKEIYERRNLIVRMKEQVSRLLSPLL
ncbi:MAG: cardiolipin synthase [Lachnospiraceae bacterium]